MPAAAPGGSASPRGAADAPGVPGASGAAGAASTAGAATRWCAACRALEDADVEYAAVCASVGRARAALATVVVVSNLGATEPGASDLGVAEPGAAELGTAHAARVARLRDAARRACGGDVRVLVPVGGDRQPKALVFVEAGGARAARFVAAALRGRADHAATVEGETPDVENVGVSAVVFSDLYDHVAPSDGGGDGGSEDGRRRASSHGSTSDDAPVSDGEPDSDDEAPASAATAASGRRGPLVLLQAPTAAARPPPDEGDLLLDRLRSGAATTLHFLERQLGASADKATSSLVEVEITRAYRAALGGPAAAGDDALSQVQRFLERRLASLVGGPPAAAAARAGGGAALAAERLRSAALLEQCLAATARGRAVEADSRQRLEALEALGRRCGDLARTVKAVELRAMDVERRARALGGGLPLESERGDYVGRPGEIAVFRRDGRLFDGRRGQQGDGAPTAEAPETEDGGIAGYRWDAHAHGGDWARVYDCAAPVRARNAPSTGEYAPPPSEFVCPITLTMMRDPVLCADGHSYERRAIDGWLRAHATSPLTNLPLSSRDTTPNRALRAAIERHRDANPPTVV